MSEPLDVAYARASELVALDPALDSPEGRELSNLAAALDAYERARQIAKDLCPDGIEMACDECGGEDAACPAECAVRRGRALP